MQHRIYLRVSNYVYDVLRKRSAELPTTESITGFAPDANMPRSYTLVSQPIVFKSHV